MSISPSPNFIWCPSSRYQSQWCPEMPGLSATSLYWKTRVQLRLLLSRARYFRILGVQVCGIYRPNYRWPLRRQLMHLSQSWNTPNEWSPNLVSRSGWSLGRLNQFSSDFTCQQQVQKYRWIFWCRCRRKTKAYTNHLRYWPCGSWPSCASGLKRGWGSLVLRILRAARTALHSYGSFAGSLMAPSPKTWLFACGQHYLWRNYIYVCQRSLWPARLLSLTDHRAKLQFRSMGWLAWLFPQLFLNLPAFAISIPNWSHFLPTA